MLGSSALLLPCEITSGTATKGRDYSASGVLGLVGTKELRPMSARHELPSELSLRPNVDFVVAVVPSLPSPLLASEYVLLVLHYYRIPLTPLEALGSAF